MKKELEKVNDIQVTDEISVEERLEEVLEKLNYNDMPIWKKNQIAGLITDIKKTKKKEEKEKIFFELLNLMEN